MSNRYSDLTDARLAASLRHEDAAEENDTLHADDRITCYTHRCWTTDCADDPIHRNPTAWIRTAALREWRTS